ncbi:MAG TPA: hypothetical protein VG992_02325 [Candidatus Saccharimonadales bacterium]|nr:hypothetical protein [Candidatus Saccharimonadales bacterium]
MNFPDQGPMLTTQESITFEELASDLEAERRNDPVFQPFPGGDLILETYEGEAYGTLSVIWAEDSLLGFHSLKIYRTDD